MCIQNISSLEAVERYGDVPELIFCKNEQDEIEKIKRKIDTFTAGKNATLGIILKTNGTAKALYDILFQSHEVQLIPPESTVFTNGVPITSIQISKGLEFAEVIIPSANSRTYCGNHDRSLLYVACTRAIRRLSLSYSGDLTWLIGSSIRNRLCLHKIIQEYSPRWQYIG